MSRIGKKPVAVPPGVTATVDGQTVTVKGPKGELRSSLPEDVVVAMVEDGAITVDPRDDSKRRARASGACRGRWSRNLVDGVTKGFEKRLEISGVGYRAAVAGQELKLTLGYSHDIDYPIPAGHHDHDAEADRDRGRRHRQAAGRPGGGGDPRVPRPEPYKGKGVKYAGEYIFRKEGKKK